MRGYYCYYCFHGCLSLPITRAGLRSGWCGRRWQHSLHSPLLQSTPQSISLGWAQSCGLLAWLSQARPGLDILTVLIFSSSLPAWESDDLMVFAGVGLHLDVWVLRGWLAGCCLVVLWCPGRPQPSPPLASASCDPGQSPVCQWQLSWPRARPG